MSTSKNRCTNPHSSAPTENSRLLRSAIAAEPGELDEALAVLHDSEKRLFPNPDGSRVKVRLLPPSGSLIMGRTSIRAEQRHR